MFCQKCESLLMPINGVMKCSNCGYESQNEKLTEKKEMPKCLEIVEKKENEAYLPTIKIDCDKCSNNQAYFHIMQVLCCDEPETKFFKCTKCGHQWIDYD